MGNQNLRILIVCVVGSLACGGAVEPSLDASPQPPLLVDPPSSDDASAPDAPTEHFVCELSNPFRVWTLDCTTLPDGGPSYRDLPADIDCRTYFEGAGQGCVPPMGCEAWVEGELVTGACIRQP